ncbi:hypothetical protein EVAR_63002_1 [Eumeta japonica]|uniref:Uncharacterized protein n=1 Tax=Eumeta variegata TaxID=151549 RepID=A0A4C1YUV8_EUMVA|nr:hypothetical protein EVAR_63002_1 [Eumeta japonica]
MHSFVIDNNFASQVHVSELIYTAVDSSTHAQKLFKTCACTTLSHDVVQYTLSAQQDLSGDSTYVLCLTKRDGIGIDIELAEWPRGTAVRALSSGLGRAQSGRAAGPFAAIYVIRGYGPPLIMRKQFLGCVLIPGLAETDGRNALAAAASL